MKLKIISAVLLISFTSLLKISASSIFFSESENELGSFSTDEKIKTDEASFWEEAVLLLEKDDRPSSKSDDDFELYAPPPGEDGNPQKIAPLGNFDIIIFLLLSCMACIWYGRRLRMTE